MKRKSVNIQLFAYNPMTMTSALFASAYSSIYRFTSTTIPQSSGLRYYLRAYNDWVQSIYDLVLEKLLNHKITRPITKLYIGFLLMYRVICEIIGEKIPYLPVIAIVISMVCSRLHVAGYLIIIGLIIIRLDYAYNKIAAYYRKYPIRLANDFPQTQIPNPKNPIRRYMWSKTTKIVVDAAQNPMVQATAVGISGAVAWKSLDYLEAGRNAESAKLDRESAEKLAEKTRADTAEEGHFNRVSAEKLAAEQREADMQKHRESLAEEARKHRESLAAEAEQRQLDREAEYRRHRESLAAEAEQRRFDRESAERLAR